MHFKDVGSKDFKFGLQILTTTKFTFLELVGLWNFAQIPLLYIYHRVRFCFIKKGPESDLYKQTIPGSCVKIDQMLSHNQMVHSNCITGASPEQKD